MSLLKLEKVSYSYTSQAENILNNVSYTFEPETLYSIVGKSGSGKSTLLNILAGLDTPTSGNVLFQSEDIKTKGYSHHRRQNVALIFQNYNLIDYLTPLENLRLVNRKAKASVLLDLGLSETEIHRNVLQLSGGQQQRVAIGRALVSPAPIILADEPTGNLDADTAAEVSSILRAVAHEKGKCVIVVTHSQKIAAQADIRLRLTRGRLKE
ncbi:MULTISPECIES: ABC transporter ATP-binding protein [unclassified Schaalia]|uniref:ABC transporter ATP-binding protein n=1 Tax=unclassified Schaalia TaxID=2691889 RepID=UPI001E58A044|nr:MULTISPECIES: ABC transporter ATP-binding protein [unclassified Schaalia]MCD4549265.1 ABC transporter ATP-binding protein [Schaalia sp. lx-260]MCD4557074.1 ABC transporter ATP-binding protein [Schaalia sp. lx-100]